MILSFRRPALMGIGLLLLLVGAVSPSHLRAEGGFDRAYTLLPLLGPASTLATGGPTLTELGPGGVLTNPAAVLYQKNKSFLLSLGKSGEEGSNFSFAYGIPSSGWSIGYQSLSLGENFGTSDFQLGYAKKISGKFPIGVRLHKYDETFNKQDRGGYALDVTTLLVEDSGFSYGVGFRNLLSQVGGTSGAEAPALFTAGLAYAPKNAKWSLRGAFTKNFQSDKENFSQFSGGAEYRMGKALTLRGGVVIRDAFSKERDKALSMGFGYKSKSGMELNYATVLRDSTLGTLHRVDLVSSFGAKKKVEKDPTLKDGALPEIAITSEPIRVALASATTKEGEKVAVIVDDQGKPIQNQEAPFVTIRTWGPPDVKAGETVELTAVFENLGKTAATGVRLYTNKPDGTSLKDRKAIGLDTDRMSFKDEGIKFLWEIPDLPAGSFGELTVILNVDENITADKLEFFSEAGYLDQAGQPYISQESNLTEVAVIKKEKEPVVVAETVLKSFEVTRPTIMLNTDPEDSYRDLKNHWGEKEIALLKKMGLLTNFQGPFFYPDRPLDERRFYEMLLLSQIYLRFRQPLSLKVKVADGANVEVILKPAGSKEGVLLLEQKFKDEGEYTLNLEQDFLHSFELDPGDYDMVIRASNGGDPELMAKPVKILGSLVDLSPGYFETKGLSFEEGVSRLAALFGDFQVEASYLSNLLDGTQTLSRLGAAKALMSALGIRISEDDVAAYQAGSPFEGNWKEAYERLVLTLASAPISERGRKGLLDALDPLHPGGKDILTRAQGAAIIYRFLKADPMDYRPSDLLARVDALVPSAGLGGPWFRVTAGSFVSQDYAQTVAEYFKDAKNLEADVVREWVGDRPVYTVQLARNLTESAARDFGKTQGRARYPVHVLAMTKNPRLRPSESRFALDKETLDDLRRERLENSIPLHIPQMEDAERISQPFQFQVDIR